MSLKLLNMKKLTLFLFLTLLLQPAGLFATTSESLIGAAIERTTHQVTYDGRYFSIPYPGGDVPADRGVCTDVIIRSYRRIGVDLQQLVHEDMQNNFAKDPSRKLWGLRQPDSNIDHRRVPNLQVFLARHGQQLTITNKSENYAPGDLVTWMLPGNLPHIGIVTDRYNQKTKTPMIVHKIGRGPVLEDMLFAFPITGHYRYLP